MLLTGHDHDLAIGYDGKTVMVESSEEGNFVTAIDFVASATGEGKDRKVTWSPSFRVHDSSTVDPDPEVLAVVKRYEDALSKELDVEIGTSTNELDSRSTIVRSQEAAIGNLIADAIKDSTGGDIAITNGGGIRANKQYPAGVKLTRRDILSELPFGNSTSLVESHGRGRQGGARERRLADREARRPLPAGVRPQVRSRHQGARRIARLERPGERRAARSRPEVQGRDQQLHADRRRRLRAPSRKGRVLIGTTDGKLLANEVMAYVRKKGTVDAKVEGRVIVR